MHKRTVFVLLAIAAAPFSFGCSGGHEDPGTSDSGVVGADAAPDAAPDADTTPRDYAGFAAGYCGWLFRCFPTISQPSGFASEADCRTAIAAAEADAGVACDPACGAGYAPDAATCDQLLWHSPAGCYTTDDAGTTTTGGCCTAPGTACR